MKTNKRTPLEEVLDKAKNEEQQAIADIYYAEFDTDTKVRANYAFMHLVENVNLRNMGDKSKAELAIKTIRFLGIINSEIALWPNGV